MTKPRNDKKRSRSPQESADKVSATASNTTGTRPAAADARASTERIEKTIVGQGSHKAYLSQIIRFTIFIFDNYQKYLTQPHLAAMEEADKKDKETNNNDRTALYVMQLCTLSMPLNHSAVGVTTIVS